MRMPINRGIPQRLSYQSSFSFTPPAGSQELYRVTQYARNTSLTDALPVLRGALSDLDIVAGDFTAHKCFNDYPLRSSVNGLSIRQANNFLETTNIFVYGHVEIDDIDRRTPNRPFYTGKLQSPFETPLNLPILGDAPVLIHTLDKNFIDLVTLRVAVPDGATLQLRFYDGTSALGKPTYVFFNIANSSGATVQDVFFDRHPMRGPGSITAVMTASTGAEDACLIYGAVYR